MNTLVTVTTQVSLIPTGADKDTRHRLGRFAEWQTTTGRPWHRLDLHFYRDDLLDCYAPATASAHLSTIRARYRAIIKDNATRDLLFGAVAGQYGDPLHCKAFVDEVLTRLENEIDPARSAVKTTRVQDRPDGGQVRLTVEQANALLASPGVIPLDKLRDTAILALLLCTGIREGELIALDVEDLRQRLGGELSLHVRSGKGCKERLIPYGGLVWVLAIVDKWLDAAGIEAGPVFRGLYKAGRLRPGRLSVRAVEYTVFNYPVVIDGALSRVKPHDLRRTYARRLYEAGVDLVAIQQNLGHADLKTTLGYIGALDADRRRPPAIFTFDLANLDQVHQTHRV